MNNHREFRNRLKAAPLLADGGMGTELYARGIYVNQCFDALNLSSPDLIAGVHEDYLRAGAEIIESNTFGANRFKLAPHGLGDRVGEINRLGAEIALKAASDASRHVFVAGSMGPLGRRLEPFGKLELNEARDAFAEQAAGLVKGGVDLIMIETMLTPQELLAAIQAVRETADIPIIAQFTLTDWNEAAYEDTIRRFATALSEAEVDAVGINCSIGPNKLLEAAKLLMGLLDKPVIIQPNAGELEWVDGRLICRATPEYFAEYAKRMIQSGVRIVGGCCGSTPAHIKAMASTLRALSPHQTAGVASVSVSVPSKPVPEAPKIPYRELSPMAAALEDGRFIYSVEIHPPRSPALGKLLARIEELKAAGVDLINIPDGPRASARLSAMVLAYTVRQRVGMDTVLHYTCRDRNILGMQSDLLGAEVLGLDNILCVTGDPPKLGDYPMATAVFDVDAIGLLRLADNLNHAMDLVGNPITKPTTFHLGCGVNPGALDMELEIDRLHRKLENGARYVLTQPVFDGDKFFSLLDRLNMPNVPFLVGVLPLASYRNAEFFHNEVPGMEVPADIRERLRAAGSGEEAAEIGVQVAAEALSRAAKRAAGAYIMPPFGKTELALKVIQAYKET